MIEPTIRQIWLEAEEWANGQWDENDDNSDVIVTFTSGEKWIATFVTYANVLTLSERYKQSDECLSGKYLWASDMILVDELSRVRVESVVKDLIRTDDCETAFSRIEAIDHEAN